MQCCNQSRGTLLFRWIWSTGKVWVKPNHEKGDRLALEWVGWLGCLGFHCFKQVYLGGEQVEDLVYCSRVFKSCQE